MSRQRRTLGLEYLSVFGMPLAEYAELAARIGCAFISVNYRGAANRLDERDARTLRECVSLRQELAEAVAAQDLHIELVEGFAITPELSVEKYASDLDAVAKLGARSICVVSLDKDLARTSAQFAALAEMSESRGLAVTTEVGAGVMRNFDVACRAWEQVAHQNFTLLVDTMHFFRRGANVEDLAAIPTQAIGHVQLCDVPMPAQMKDYLEEALFERRAPGDGDLPLKDFLARVASSVPIGLEIPVRSARDAGLTAESVLRRSLLAVEAMLA
jgi:sugar phosphate isomerase/epimerase